MKKAQILSALALAFALGVAVIPSANTYAQIKEGTAPNATAETAMYDEAQALLDKVAGFEHFAEYKTLYSAIEGTNNNGLADQLDTAAEDLLSWYNSQVIAANGDPNTKIDTALAFTGSSNANQLQYIQNGQYVYAKHADKTVRPADLKTISAFTRVNTAEAAYNAIASMLDAVEYNLGIIANNYADTAQTVQDAKAAYEAVQTMLSDLLATAGNFFASAPAPTAADLAENIRAIDRAAYNAMVGSDAWNDNYDGVTTIKAAAQQGLAIKTARGLAKYNYVDDLQTAVTRVNMILRNSGTEVTYANGQTYINELKVAIANYENGKPNTGNTGDGTNKPEEGGNKAPNTGILADAEGNASTTVAMVAGIATALTAAGAGVVAYRNARRSTRK